jgi:putative phosphonate metabolism protein
MTTTDTSGAGAPATIGDGATNDAAGYGFGDARYAIYLAPPVGHPLKRFADAWLGRDPDEREPVPQPIVEGLPPERLHDITAAPRQYGFHATLKAPFALAEGAEAGALRDDLEAFAAGRRPLAARLEVAVLDGFIALVPAGGGAPPELEDLAAACVRDFDRYRAPLTDEERSRRNPERLSEREREHLERWGYPHVLDLFRFHMTLTERLQDPELSRVRLLLEQVLAPVLAEPVPFRDVALVAQTHRVAPFNVAARFPFGGRG